jgi:hypothetical protein
MFTKPQLQVKYWMHLWEKAWSQLMEKNGFSIVKLWTMPSIKKSSRCHVANIYDECLGTIYNFILKWNIVWRMTVFLYAWKHSISYSFETIENCWGCPPF